MALRVAGAAYNPVRVRDRRPRGRRLGGVADLAAAAVLLTLRVADAADHAAAHDGRPGCLALGRVAHLAVAAVLGLGLVAGALDGAVVGLDHVLARTVGAAAIEGARQPVLAVPAGEDLGIAARVPAGVASITLQRTVTGTTVGPGRVVRAGPAQAEGQSERTDEQAPHRLLLVERYARIPRRPDPAPEFCGQREIGNPAGV